MFKKILATSILFSVAAASTAAPYIAGGLGVVSNTSKSSSFRGATLNAALGYGALIKQDFYLGGEGFATFLTGTLDNNPAATSMRTTYSFGLSVLPGYMLSEHTMAFVRAGLLRTRFTRPASTVTGGQVGIGMQTSVTQNWDVRGEYDYVGYHQVMGTTPHADQFNFALVYKME